MVGFLDRVRAQAALRVDEARPAVRDLRVAQLEADIDGTLRHFARQLSLEKGVLVQVEKGGFPACLEEAVVRNVLRLSLGALT